MVLFITGDTYYKIEKRWADCGKRNKDNNCSGFEQKSPWYKRIFGL
jgi:hypothetical protein